MKLFLITWFVCIFAFLSVKSTYAEERDSTESKLQHSLGLDFKTAYVFPTDRFFKGENAGQTPIRKNLSAHLKYGIKFLPATYLGKYYPYAVQGIGIGYNSFNNPTELGDPLSLYVFQSSRIVTLGRRLSLDYEWNFGASFGWKKYDERTNFYNRVIGSKINAYISFGVSLDWRITPASNLRIGAMLSHYSNGNTRFPNGGINTIGGTVGFVHCLGRADKRQTPGNLNSDIECGVLFRPHMSYDVVIYGATKKKDVLLEGDNVILIPGSFAIAGLNFTPFYNFSKFFRAGLSLDMQYDESANISEHIADINPMPDNTDVKFYRPPLIEQFSVGFSLRAEVVMPVFQINLGVGKNVVCRGSDTNSFYQIFALKANMTKNLFLHVGYQLYRFQDPNNLMLGVGFRFNARGGK